jgi:hypothetical protein
MRQQQRQTQISFGNDNKKEKRMRQQQRQTQIPVGNDNKKTADS